MRRGPRWSESRVAPSTMRRRPRWPQSGMGFGDRKAKEVPSPMQRGTR